MAHYVKAQLHRFYLWVFPYSVKDAGVPGFARH